MVINETGFQTEVTEALGALGFNSLIDLQTALKQLNSLERKQFLLQAEQKFPLDSTEIRIVKGQLGELGLKQEQQRGGNTRA